jgi:hypothetical protein
LRVAINIEFVHHPSVRARKFQTAVRTVFPFHVTSRGRPTFTESSRPTNTSGRWISIVALDLPSLLTASDEVLVGVAGAEESFHMNCAFRHLQSNSDISPKDKAS